MPEPSKRQALLFGDPSEETVPFPLEKDGSWIPNLTQRLKTLLLTSPIHRLEAARNQYGDDMSAVDLRVAALRALDAVIENMGLGTGAPREAIVAAMEPIILRSEADPSPDRVRAVANRVLDALLNDRDQRSEFEEPYLDLTSADVRWLAHRFRLLREEELADGSIVIRATTEGINLYLGMLEFDVASAQAATEAVLHEQIRRGHIDKAVATAQQARYRSIQFEQELQDTLRTVRRDISQVEWVRDVLPKLDEARERIQERLAIEGELIEIVSQRLDQASPGDALHLVRLLDTIRDCQQRHLRLNEQLIPANATFLDEQARQGFRSTVPTNLVDTESEVLVPAMALPSGVIADELDVILWSLHSPFAPCPLDLHQLITRLLAPRREETVTEYEVDKPDLEEVLEVAGPFSEEDFVVARRFIESTVPAYGGMRLSALLAAAREQGVAAQATDCLVLTVMRAFDPLGLGEGRRDGTVRVEPTGAALYDRRYFGDELLVTKGNKDDVA